MHRTPNRKAGAARLDTFPQEKNGQAGGGKAVAKQQHAATSILQYSINALLKCFPLAPTPARRAKKSPLWQRAESILGGE
jgi:hypothetical protein